MTIPIRNLYYLFTYAWGRFPGGASIDRGIDESPDLPNLFARLLIDDTNRLLRRGLDRGYQANVEEARAPRGRLLLDAIVKQQTMRRGAVVCAFDELTVDVLHNQIIKATIVSLVRSRNLVADYRHRLGLIAQRLAGITDIRLSNDAFRRVQLSRNTSQYLPLMKLSELVFRSQLPDQEGTGTRFADILKDEVIMSSVFEDFLRNFFAFEQKAYSVGRENMTWDAVPLDGTNPGHLPIMETDVTLRSADRVIILDAKFYKEALVERHGNKKIHASNLYQLTTYLYHARKRYDGRAIAGGLIYPAVGDSIDLRYRIQGHRVMIRSVDLTRPWQEIHDDLLRIPTDLAGPSEDPVLLAATA